MLFPAYNYETGTNLFLFLRYWKCSVAKKVACSMKSIRDYKNNIVSWEQPRKNINYCEVVIETSHCPDRLILVLGRVPNILKNLCDIKSRERMEKAYDFIRETQLMKQKRQEHSYDRNRRKPLLEGNPVWLWSKF